MMRPIAFLVLLALAASSGCAAWQQARSSQDGFGGMAFASGSVPVARPSHRGCH